MSYSKMVVLDYNLGVLCVVFQAEWISFVKALLARIYKTHLGDVFWTHRVCSRTCLL